jgi:hypothetical protein
MVCVAEDASVRPEKSGDPARVVENVGRTELTGPPVRFSGLVDQNASVIISFVIKLDWSGW